MDLKDILGIERYTELKDKFIKTQGDPGPSGIANNRFELLQSNYYQVGSNQDYYGFERAFTNIAPNDTIYVIAAIASRQVSLLNVRFVWVDSVGSTHSLLSLDPPNPPTPMMGLNPAYILKLNSNPNNPNEIVVTSLGSEKKISFVQVAPTLNGQFFINDLILFGGSIYGGTSSGGRLFRWNGSNAWVEVAPQLNAQPAIAALVSYSGTIYGGTSNGGRLFQWNGVNAWVEVAPQLGAEAILSMIVYNNKIYAGTGGGGIGGALLEWNGVNAWVQVAPQFNPTSSSIYGLVEFNNNLYGCSNDGYLYKWNGVNAWQIAANPLPFGVNAEGIRSMIVYNNKIYGGTLPYGGGSVGGKLYEWNGVGAWVEVAPQFAAQTYIFSLVAYNGQLYGGTYPNSRLHVWDGVSAWQAATSIQFGSENRIASMVVSNGKIYGGTASNGKLGEWSVMAQSVVDIGEDWKTTGGKIKVRLHTGGAFALPEYALGAKVFYCRLH